MKKIGIIVFIGAILIGVLVANFFSFGRVSSSVFNFSFNVGEKGSGNVGSETRDLSDFRVVELGGVFQVEITAQKDYSVQIEADDNLLQFIKTEINGDTLEISTERKLSTKNPIRVRISAPDIEGIQTSGASKVSIADIKNGGFKVDSSGASKVAVAGETAKLIVDVSGGSHIDAENLKAENATVNASGASHVNLFVSGNLRSDASGASRITYSGNPKNVEKKSSGASSVHEK